jgi:hypothetical protein
VNLKITERKEGGFSITREGESGAESYPVETKYELVYQVIEILFKFLSTEK